MTPARPGIEELGGARPGGGDAAFGLLLGFVLSAVLVALLPDVRSHLLGGTERRTTTVLSAEGGPRPGDQDREVARYVLAWRDDSGAQHTSTFVRSGPVRLGVGETVEMWVSEDRPAATDESPLRSWLWFGAGIPLAGAGIGWLWGWRQRVAARIAARSTAAGLRRRRARERGPDA